MDIRMKEITLNLGGEERDLRCNFRVLAEVDAHAGVRTVLSQGNFSTTLEFLTAMLNDWAKRHKRSERYTLDDAAELVESYDGTYMDLTNKVSELVFQAITQSTEENEDNPKN